MLDIVPNIAARAPKNADIDRCGPQKLCPTDFSRFFRRSRAAAYITDAAENGRKRVDQFSFKLYFGGWQHQSFVIVRPVTMTSVLCAKRRP
jgi:hypothetical protein